MQREGFENVNMRLILFHRQYCIGYIVLSTLIEIMKSVAFAIFS